MIRPFIFVMLAAMLAGCTTPSVEQRIRTRLIAAGIAQPIATCMADRLVHKLSLGQLRKLQSLSDLGQQDVRSMPIELLLRRLRALDDPEIVTVVTRVGIGCTIAG